MASPHCGQGEKPTVLSFFSMFFSSKERHNSDKLSGENRILKLMSELRNLCVCVSCSPLQLSAPQYVLLPVHQDREMLILSLFDGVGACRNCTDLPEL